MNQGEQAIRQAPSRTVEATEDGLRPIPCGSAADTPPFILNHFGPLGLSEGPLSTQRAPDYTGVSSRAGGAIER